MAKRTIMYICDKHACKRQRGRKLLCAECPGECGYASDHSHEVSYDAGPDGTLWERMNHSIEEKED